jgi:alpha-amylase
MIMKVMPAPKKAPLSIETVQRMLRKVPNQEAFYFSRGIGDYTGQAATSLSEFAEMLRTVDSKSIEFHMERKDFERWIRNVFGDEELAQTVSRTAGSKGENRRNELVMVTTKRLNDLRNLLKTQ